MIVGDGAIAIKDEKAQNAVAPPLFAFYRTKKGRPPMAAFVEQVMAKLGTTVAGTSVPHAPVLSAYKLIAAVLDPALTPDPNVQAVSVADTVQPT